MSLPLEGSFHICGHFGSLFLAHHNREGQFDYPHALYPKENNTKYYATEK